MTVATSLCSLALVLLATATSASALKVDSTLLEKAKEDHVWLLSIRRELHTKPELMYKEYETSKVIQRELESIGIPFVAGIGGTGVVATLGSGEGPVIGLRADMDALPLDEESSVEFKSENEGRMHACGHDIHVTMLLGAARLLKRMEKQGELGRGESSSISNNNIINISHKKTQNHSLLVSHASCHVPC